MDDASGLRLRLAAVVGTGSYAVVYLVKDEESGEQYALKCLSKENLTATQIEMQRSEAVIHKSLAEHPNIVTLHCSFETDSWLYLVLEFCDGQDLYFWLTQNNDARHPKTGDFLERFHRYQLVQNIFDQMLEAVAFCHKNGVAHRDIKPENFIVVTNTREAKASPYGVVIKLTDFGLATRDRESADFDCGSKPYMSFECRNNLTAKYLPRDADVWSLGIVLLNLLYHRSPWAEPKASSCPSFASFQRDQAAFLMRRFDDMPRSVATFLTYHVFCRAESGRTTVNEWIQWNRQFAERMNGNLEECAKCGKHLAPPSPIKVSQSVPTTSYFPLMQQPGNLPTSTSPAKNQPVSNSAVLTDSDFCAKCQELVRESPRNDTWSNVFSEDEDEMDFSAPVIWGAEQAAKSRLTPMREVEEEEDVFEMRLTPPSSPKQAPRAPSLKSSGSFWRRRSSKHVEESSADSGYVENDDDDNSITPTGTVRNSAIKKTRSPMATRISSWFGKEKDGNEAPKTEDINMDSGLYSSTDSETKATASVLSLKLVNTNSSFTSTSTTDSSHWTSNTQRRERLKQKHDGIDYSSSPEKHKSVSFHAPATPSWAASKITLSSSTVNESTEASKDKSSVPSKRPGNSGMSKVFGRALGSKPVGGTFYGVFDEMRGDKQAKSSALDLAKAMKMSSSTTSLPMVPAGEMSLSPVKKSRERSRSNASVKPPPSWRSKNAQRNGADVFDKVVMTSDFTVPFTVKPSHYVPTSPRRGPYNHGQGYAHGHAHAHGHSNKPTPILSPSPPKGGIDWSGRDEYSRPRSPTRPRSPVRRPASPTRRPASPTRVTRGFDSTNWVEDRQRTSTATSNLSPPSSPALAANPIPPSKKMPKSKVHSFAVFLEKLSAHNGQVKIGGEGRDGNDSQE